MSTTSQKKAAPLFDAHGEHWAAHGCVQFTESESIVIRTSLFAPFDTGDLLMLFMHASVESGTAGHGIHLNLDEARELLQCLNRAVNTLATVDAERATWQAVGVPQ